ncbi:MAG: hypothetical protein IKQ73_08685 [Oscillospiraceae bacterium]|nr:hypothetical protein [Oscillospiraceae bacterium]MBR6207224.1 hypothetical protein [Oscillospiraceae bacterium]
MDSILFLFFLGALIIVIGVRNLKGDVATVHRYHRKRVSEEDRIPFGKKIGTGTVIIGCAVVAKACAQIAADKGKLPLADTVGTVVLIAGLAAGFVFILYAMIKYNKGVF